MNLPSPNPETLPEKQGRVFNVASNSSDPTEAVLSNLARSPFELDGRRYESVEGFWQGLKFPDGDVRENIASMHGIASKKVGNGAVPADTFTYLYDSYVVGSPEHQGLMKRAIRAKLEQNPEILALLLATGDAKIIHEPMRADGSPYPDSTTIPGVVFSKILMELREEFGKGEVQRSLPDASERVVGILVK